MKHTWIWIGAALAIASCGSAPESSLRLVPAPERFPLEPQAAPAVVKAPAAPASRLAPPAPDPFAALRQIGERGGVIAPFADQIMEAGSSYGLKGVPESSQARAQKAALDWAADARQIFVGWGYWKKPWISFVRHGYYSAQRDQALMVDVPLTKWVLRKTEEPGENYRDAAGMLRETEDRHRISAKLAVELARREGYQPKRVHVAALVNLPPHGPFWVIVDDHDWSPSMVIHAESGQVQKTGPMVEAARFLMGSQRGKDEPSPSPSPSPSQSPGGTLPGF